MDKQTRYYGFLLIYTKITTDVRSEKFDTLHQQNSPMRNKYKNVVMIISFIS